MLKPFLLGAAAYPALEILWRGRSHVSMALAGGASMLLIDHVGKVRKPLLTRALLCGTGITAIEYVCGTIWNRSYRVWDYRHIPLNLQGQICLPYSLLWCGLSAGVIAAQEHFRR